MKLLYLGYYVDPDYYNDILNSGYTVMSHARQNFEGRLLNEFSKSLNDDDWDIVTYIPYIKEEHPTESQINGKRFKVVKINRENPLSSLKAFFNFRRYILDNNIRDCNVLVYSTQPILSLPLFTLRKRLNLKLTTICSEVPQFQSAAHGKNASFAKKVSRKLKAAENHKFDKYVLFAEEMKNVIPTGDKKYIVVEGICPDEFTSPVGGKENIVMYAGGFGSFNNLDLLIDACNKSEKVSELWLFGAGNSLDEIKKKATGKIKYMGNLPSNEVFEYEKKAKLLVNLRNPEVELTKYAFPSKTLEYMSSGSAVLSTKLEGIPSEYFDYIETVEDLTVNGIKEAIEKVLDLDDETYISKCQKAQSFMRENKTAEKQAARILDFVLND